MPLTTYVIGEVLTAASLNANLTFAAANPPASASGFNFISATSFTTATNVSLPANTFSATYSNYKVMFEITTLSADADFTMRLRAAGTDNTTSNYRTAGVGVTSSNAASNVTGNAQTSFNMSESDANISTTYSFSIDVISPQAATNTNFLGSLQTFNKAGSSGLIGVHIVGNHLSNSQFDSLTFISSVASSMTGTVKAYGYANS